MAKRSRDARAHFRIVRKYPKKRRPGTDFDFIGSSTLVLLVAPLWFTAFLTGLPFLYFYLNAENKSWDEVQTWWQTNVLLVTLAMLLVQELILWRGPLGVVNRTAIFQSRKNRFYVYSLSKG